MAGYGPPTHCEYQMRETVKITSHGKGCLRYSTITRSRVEGRKILVTIEYKHHGPFGWLRDRVWNFLSKNAD